MHIVKYFLFSQIILLSPPSTSGLSYAGSSCLLQRICSQLWTPWLLECRHVFDIRTSNAYLFPDFLENENPEAEMGCFVVFNLITLFYSFMVLQVKKLFTKEVPYWHNLTHPYYITTKILIYFRFSMKIWASLIEMGHNNSLLPHWTLNICFDTRKAIELLFIYIIGKLKGISSFNLQLQRLKGHHK